MTNMQLSKEVIWQLLKVGVREFCLCAGARNSPLIHFFDANPQLKTFHFFEERSASFFALGRMAQTRRPVAVITTSGTAAAELLPATVEATYSSLPLILVTADRPKSFRGRGAPQTIEQVGLFSYYIEACFDLDEENNHISLNGLSWKKPVHINLCYKEPLLDGEPEKVTTPSKEERTKFPISIPLDMFHIITEFLKTNKVVVIVSQLPEKAKQPVLEFLKKLKAPVYVEAISGLRGHKDLKDLSLNSGEKILSYLLEQGHCNAVLRIGGVPTVRFWRDLEDKFVDIPVLSLGYSHYTGLSREIIHFSDLEDLPRLEMEEYFEIPPQAVAFDRKKAETLNALFKKYPHSEPGLIHQLSMMTKNKPLYLGNSLPVREWDLAAGTEFNVWSTVANRGANGIDGQISTYLGWSPENEESWCVVGDLTALYDLSALWVTKQLSPRRLRIVVVNNSGGMIFQRLFHKEIYLNRHEINFKPWSELWGWDYSTWTEIPQETRLSEHHIIELKPSEKETELFWQEWEREWQ